MAALTQTITVNPTIETFGGLTYGPNNQLPRARVTFFSETDITLKAAGNTNRVIWNCDLPSGYAYRLDQVHICVNQVDSLEVGQFDVLGALLYHSNGLTPDNFSQLKSEGLTISTGGVTSALQIWNVINPWGEVILNRLGTSPRLAFMINDTDAVNETVAMTDNVFRVSVLQYDIQQVLNSVVNAPTPVTLT